MEPVPLFPRIRSADETEAEMRSRREAGFTLIELMMVVALIGVVSAIAIPNFLSYQARTRRGEAYANVAAIARAQKAYQAELGSYLETDNAYPDFGSLGPGFPGTKKMDWDAASETAFGDLGWIPEGDVFYAYGVTTNDSTTPACVCNLCFTVTAYGDTDGDGSASAVMYVDPDRDEDGVPTASCTSHLGGFGAPTRNGAPVYNEVAVNRSADEY